MAGFAATSQLILVPVILQMARHTLTVQARVARVIQGSLGRQVTGVALDLLMARAQRVIGVPIVVERDVAPCFGRMTGFTPVTISTFVATLAVILDMTGNAASFEFELACLVAGYATNVTCFALDAAVFVAQREVRLVMVEVGAFPSALVVARCALFAQFAVMPFLLVILLVACDALLRNLRVIQLAKLRHMAAVATDLTMPGLQCIVRVGIVVEPDLFPTAINVASCALCAIATFVSLVLIVFPVASVTVQRCCVVDTVLMAVSTFDVGMLAARQRKSGFFMVKTGILPGSVVMAVLTLLAETPFVSVGLVVLRVARYTGHGRIAVPCAGTMTAGAINR